MTAMKSFNLALAFLFELCALAALAFWGFHTGQGLLVKILLGIGAPLLAALIWGAFAAPRAMLQVPAFTRYLVMLLVFGSAVVALALAGQALLAWIFAGLVVANRLLVAVWKQ
jgi:hypothetical protein